MRSDDQSSGESTFVKAAFGAKNRERLITKYFDEHDNEQTSAGTHVYRLLMWIDQTTGLAHCYESDKSQPGKGWYPRSLAFHEWLADSLGSAPAQLANHVD